MEKERVCSCVSERTLREGSGSQERESGREDADLKREIERERKKVSVREDLKRDIIPSE